MPDYYAVVGNPIAHSMSPEIHAAFARELGHSIVYERKLAPLGQFAVAVDAIRAMGAKGINVTLPFKLDAYHYATEHTPRAAAAGAANTLRFLQLNGGARIVADNTDGIGLVRDMGINLGRPITQKRVLVLGAGGAARGVMGALLDEKPASISISNRTAGKARELAAHFSNVCAGTRIEVVEPQQLTVHQYDIVINATAASLNDGLPLMPTCAFAGASFAYDMMYGKGVTPFLRLAANAGAATADGLGMLVEQAAEAYFVWRGVRPQTAPVIAAMRQSLRARDSAS